MCFANFGYKKTMRIGKTKNAKKHSDTTSHSLKSYHPSHFIHINHPSQLKTISSTTLSPYISISCIQTMSAKQKSSLFINKSFVAIRIDDRAQLEYMIKELACYSIRPIIFSKSIPILLEAHAQLKVSERVWICKDINFDLDELTATINQSGIRSILLEAYIAKDVAQHFQKRAILVWSMIHSLEDLHQIYRSNVNVMIMDEPSLALASDYAKQHILAKPIIVAHRGAPQLELENTVASFDLAAVYGADVLELDIRRTSDHQLVLFHDSTVNRTTPSKGPVSSYTFDQLAAIYPIISLNTFLEHFKGSDHLFLLELKERDTVSDVLDLVNKHRMEQRVHIQSFDPLTLKEVRDQHPSIGISLLYTPNKWSKHHISTPVIKNTLLHTQASINVKISKRYLTGFSFEGGPSFVWTIQTKQVLEAFWAKAAHGLIIDNIQQARAIPIGLSLHEQPKIDLNHRVQLPKKAKLHYLDGVTKLVDVQWLAQNTKRLISIETNDFIGSPLALFCKYSFQFAGQLRSHISELTMLQPENHKNKERMTDD